MAQREVYRNPPLRLVALDFRFPTTGRVLNRKVWDAFEACLGELLPVVETFISGDPEDHLPRGPREPALRRLSFRRDRAVTLYAGGITLEVGDYQSFTDLKALTRATLKASQTVAGGIEATSVGLRYINEILAETVLPEGEGWQLSKSWKPYINAELLRETKTPPEGLCAYAEHGELLLHNLDEEAPGWVVLNYGIHPDGVVSPVGVLSLEDKPGPCFLLDIDSNRYAWDDQPAARGTTELLKVVEDLHTQVEATFNWAITDAMREVFRADVDADALRAVGA